MSDFFAHESAYIDQPCQIGEGTMIWHYCHIMKGAVIGSHCVLGQGVFVASTARLGNQIKIQNHVSIYDAVTLEDGVFCGPSMVFTNVINPRSRIERKNEYRPTLVKTGASIGANATIVCGVTIGAHAFIGAGAVVTRNVPDYALAYGNPARVRGWVSRHGSKLVFGRNGMAVCPGTGERYKRLDDHHIILLAGAETDDGQHTLC